MHWVLDYWLLFVESLVDIAKVQLFGANANPESSTAVCYNWLLWGRVASTGGSCAVSAGRGCRLPRKSDGKKVTGKPKLALAA